MVDVNKSVIARYSKANKHFEILVDCDKAIDFKHGKAVSLSDVLATKDIYTTVSSAKHATEEDLNAVFKTLDHNKIASVIISEGEIQLTVEHKNKLREQKRKQLITLIQRNAINPQNNLPHPPARIETAFTEAKIKVDEFASAEDQLPAVVKALTKILPIRMETRTLQVIIPATYASKSFHVLKSYGRLISEQWNTKGSLVATLEIPAGLQEELESKLNDFTKGDYALTIETKGEKK